MPDGFAPRVGHPAHAEDDVRRDGTNRSAESGGEPIESQIGRLEDPPINCLCDGGVQGAARAKCQERGRLSGDGESVGEKHRLPLGPTASQIVLHDEDFHCSAGD